MLSLDIPPFLVLQHSNSLGWRIFTTSLGLIICPPRTPWNTVSQYIPFIANLVLVGITVIAGPLWPQANVIVIAALPLTALLSWWFFIPSAVYINTRKRIVMGGSFFPRFSLDDLSMATKEDYTLEIGDSSNYLAIFAWQGDSEGDVDEVQGILARLSAR